MTAAVTTPVWVRANQRYVAIAGRIPGGPVHHEDQTFRTVGGVVVCDPQIVSAGIAASGTPIRKTIMERTATTPVKPLPAPVNAPRMLAADRAWLASGGAGAAGGTAWRPRCARPGKEFSA